MTLVLALLAGLMAVWGAAAPALAGSLRTTGVITYNLQGATTGNDGKWFNTIRGYAIAADVVMVQEAGPQPPRDFVENIIVDPTAPGRSGYVQRYSWPVADGRYRENFHVYYLQTDANGGNYVGGRNNLAIVTRQLADEVRIITNHNGAPSARNALGIRLGNEWYYSFHALSGSAADAPAMTRTMADNAQGRNWTIGADFNTEPGTFAQPDNSYRYATGLPTQQSGRELDWVLSSENIRDLPVERRRGEQADHYAVQVGTMRAAAEPPDLRILPLGDSITFGEGSSDGSGYRRELWEDLKNQTTTRTSFVGSQHNGSIPDNDHEGHSGWRIEDIAGITDNAMSTYRPNVVLLHIGTNDMNTNRDPAGAPRRLGELIDRIIRDQPEVAVVVSTLVPARDPVVEGRIAAYNNSIPDVVAERQNAGKHVWMVDMDPVDVSDLADVLHPNDSGYRKMGDIFYQGVQSLEVAGWVKPPPGDDPGNGGSLGAPNWFAKGNIASGYGASINPDPQPGADPPGPRSAYHLADLNGDGRDDYIKVAGDYRIAGWLNGSDNPAGTPTWNYLGLIGPPLPATDIVDFADIDGDHRADLLVIGGGGNGYINAFHNAGPGSSGGWRWNPLGRIAPGVGAPGSLVRMADINGDSRADYLVMGRDNGSVQAWINNGPSASSDSGWAWDAAGMIASGVGVPAQQIVFADVTGDGRADYLSMGADNGSVTLWENGGPATGWAWYPRGRIAGGAGAPSARVMFGHLHARTGPNNNARADYVVFDDVSGAMNMWLSLGPPASGSGDWNWDPMGSIANGERGRVLFAHIDADARDDYVYLAANGAVYTWLNGGPDRYDWHYKGRIAPGVGVPGREVTFADIDGDGDDDYLTVHPGTGAVTFWENQGASAASDSGWAWQPRGRIASGVGARGENIRFADVDGDRRDDYVVLGASNGSITAWSNGGFRPGSPIDPWNWNALGQIAPGVGSPASQIRLARLYTYPNDTTASRRVDYLRVNDDSSVHGWQNAGPSTASPSGWAWNPQGIVAAGVPAATGGTRSAPGSHIHFADINGDGRDDYLDIDPANGSVWAWTNTNTN
ncbi:FG-GAP-like repeat-containing protein [Streptomyces sp. NPDC127584]|uniref:FG-GAP-like repeat-containing protein n=1 Tax=Streptomyces sp. NPDC127584 TaxID=3345403 RepID=UPI00363838A1